MDELHYIIIETHARAHRAHLDPLHAPVVAPRVRLALQLRGGVREHRGGVRDGYRVRQVQLRLGGVAEDEFGVVQHGEQGVGEEQREGRVQSTELQRMNGKCRKS